MVRARLRLLGLDRLAARGRGGALAAALALSLPLPAAVLATPPGDDRDSDAVKLLEGGSETDDQPATKPKPPAAAIGQQKPPPADRTRPGSPASSPSSNASSPQFAQALAKARAALRERQIARAETLLRDAAALATTPEEGEAVERTKLLAQYAAGFWDAVGESLAALQPADEIELGKLRVAVVEVSRDSLTVKMQGRIQTWSRRDMPAEVAVPLAERWFDKRAANKLYLGAFHAADAKGDLAEARRQWEAATRGGASAADLLPLLEEKAAAPLVRQPVPGPAALARSMQAVKTRFAAEIRQARSAPKRAELAARLALAAAGEGDPAQRYALFQQSLALSREAADAQSLLSTIDELARAFEVDALQLKSDALAKLGSASNNSLVCQAVAQGALDLVEQALAEERLDQANKLAEAARDAAAKSRSAELVRRAKAGHDRVQSLMKAKGPRGAAG